jgi:hypothetical protein
MSMFYEQITLSGRLMMASNGRSAKLDNSYGALILPAAIFCVSPDKVRALPPGAKTFPTQSESYYALYRFGSHCRAESYTTIGKSPIAGWAAYVWVLVLEEEEEEWLPGWG